MSDDRGIEFKISAPGRIVLSGEHSAMYGKSFVMAGLNLRTNLAFCELRNAPKNIIKLDFVNVNLRADILLEEVERLFSDNAFEDLFSNPVDLLEYVRNFITVNSMWRTREERFSLQMFFFLLYTIAHRETLKLTPFHVLVSSDIPIGAGLGSSTSFAVCLAACFLHWKRLQSGPHTEFNDADLSSIKRYTECCEKIMQDYGFAKVDAEVCVHGKIQKCQLTNYNSYSVDIMDLTTEMKIILINSNLKQNKEARAQQMVELECLGPSFRIILNIFDEIARTTYGQFNHIKNSIKSVDGYQFAYTCLQEIIERNQWILNTYNLSFPKIDELCSRASVFRLKGKLTGFGGGYVYFLLPQSNLTITNITDMEKNISRNDFDTGIITSINCEGVKINN